MNNSDLCQNAVKLVDETINKDNLLLSFIAGSRAKDNYNPKSDVDLFVILKRPLRNEEELLSRKLQEFHEINNLKYEHCGEIFSQDTLEIMLKSCPNLSELIKVGFSESACFQAECILSIARKTLVVLHMLASEKKMITGDRNALSNYENVAKDFYSNHSNIFICTSQSQLNWVDTPSTLKSVHDEWKRIMRKIHKGDFNDTPIGTSLDKWFKSNRFVQSNIKNEKLTQKQHFFSKTKCPLIDKSIQNNIFKLFQKQCLGSVENNSNNIKLSSK